MAFEQRDNTGSIFKNDKKTTDAHPDGSGSAMIGGVEYWVSSWTKKDKNGNPWRSLAFKRKDEKPQAKPAKQEVNGGLGDMTDDVPF